MSTALARIDNNALARSEAEERARFDAKECAYLVALVTNAVTSAHTKRAYARAIADFHAWWVGEGRPVLANATVQEYVAQLHAEKRGASSINQRLAAIRKLARKMNNNGRMDDATAAAIRSVEGIRAEGHKTGNWLSREQAQALLELPDVATLKGLRDRAILAVLLGAGLRREECATLTVKHLQQREGRWVIVDLIGKRQKLRSVPLPSWAKSAIDAWLKEAGISAGLVFRATRRGGHLQEHGMTAQSIFEVVREYAPRLREPVPVRPHDLRRTYAKLAHKGKAPLEQIQLSLGHSSVQTTERYLGVSQDLTAAPCDVLGLHL